MEAKKLLRLPSFHLILFEARSRGSPLCLSSEIEPSADDIHAELVEDEDEEVTLQAVVVVVMVVLVRREETKYSEIHIVLSFNLLLATIHFGSHILSI